MLQRIYMGASIIVFAFALFLAYESSQASGWTAFGFADAFLCLFAVSALVSLAGGGLVFSAIKNKQSFKKLLFFILLSNPGTLLLLIRFV